MPTNWTAGLIQLAADEQTLGSCSSCEDCTHGQRWDRGNVTVQAFGVPELTSLAARAKTTDKSTSRQRVAVVVFISGPFQLESSTRAARHQLHGSQRLLKPVRTQALVQVRIVNCVCANLTF